MTKYTSHYDSLNVTRDAPAEVIRAAYRSLTQKHHPDKNIGNDDAAQTMMRLNSAYSVLSDPVLRQQYDMQLLHGQSADNYHHVHAAPGERIAAPSWLQQLELATHSGKVRLVAALCGVGLIGLLAIMQMIWQENQSALRLERAAIYAAPQEPSWSDAGTPLSTPSTAQEQRSRNLVISSATSSATSSAINPPTPITASAPASSDYERLTAMLKNMGFGLHKLDTGASRKDETQRPPAHTDAGAPALAAAVLKPLVATEPAPIPAPATAAAAAAAPAPPPIPKQVQVDTPVNATESEARACPTPRYPITAYRNGESGTVVLALRVGSDGRVLESAIKKTSGYSDLDKAARLALSQCQFKPAGPDGSSAWTSISYVWSLD